MSREVNLLGGFYVSKALPWSAQDTVNWLPVASASGGTRSPFKLKAAPGLRPLSVLMVVTTPTYPLECIESFDILASVGAGFMLAEYAEGFDISASITAGELRPLLIEYTRYQPEGFDISASITAGELRQILVEYTRYQPEGFDINASITAGELRLLLIEYTNYQPEGFDINASITGGALT